MQLSTGGRDQCLCTDVYMQAYAVQMPVCMEPCAGTVCVQMCVTLYAGAVCVKMCIKPHAGTVCICRYAWSPMQRLHCDDMHGATSRFCVYTGVHGAMFRECVCVCRCIWSHMQETACMLMCMESHAGTVCKVCVESYARAVLMQM